MANDTQKTWRFCCSDCLSDCNNVWFCCFSKKVMKSPYGSMHRVKSNGPSTEPFGTSVPTLTKTNCSVRDKYDLNQANVILLISIMCSSFCKRMLLISCIKCNTKIKQDQYRHKSIVCLNCFIQIISTLKECSQHRKKAYHIIIQAHWMCTITYLLCKCTVYVNADFVVDTKNNKFRSACCFVSLLFILVLKRVCSCFLPVMDKKDTDLMNEGRICRNLKELISKKMWF